MKRSSFLKLLGAAAVAGVAAPALASATPAAAATGFQKYGTYAHGTLLPDVAGPVSRGGVIRFTPTGPKLHVNSTHQSVGIIPKSVRINASGDLEFRMDLGMPIMTVQVSPDETLVQRKISGGLSGGGSLCIVRFTRGDMGPGEKLNLNLPGHYARIAGSTSNVWVGVTSYYGG